MFTFPLFFFLSSFHCFELQFSFQFLIFPGDTTDDYCTVFRIIEKGKHVSSDKLKATQNKWIDKGFFSTLRTGIVLS